MKFCNKNMKLFYKTSMQFVANTFKKYSGKAKRIYLFQVKVTYADHILCHS